MVLTKAEERKKKKAESTRKPTKKKPKDKPKRPRSAYNYFFQQERQKILVYLARDKSIPSTITTTTAEGSEEIVVQVIEVVDVDQEKRLIKETGKVSFEEMGKIIGSRWKTLPSENLSTFTKLALGDTERYKQEMIIYNKKQDDAATRAMNAQNESAAMNMQNGSMGAGGPLVGGPYGGAQGNLYPSPYGVPGMPGNVPQYNMPGGNMGFPGMQMNGYSNPNYPGYGYPYQQYYGGQAAQPTGYPQSSPGGPVAANNTPLSGVASTQLGAPTSNNAPSNA